MKFVFTFLTLTAFIALCSISLVGQEKLPEPVRKKVFIPSGELKLAADIRGKDDSTGTQEKGKNFSRRNSRLYRKRRTAYCTKKQGFLSPPISYT